MGGPDSASCAPRSLTQPSAQPRGGQGGAASQPGSHPACPAPGFRTPVPTPKEGQTKMGAWQQDPVPQRAEGRGRRPGARCSSRRSQGPGWLRSRLTRDLSGFLAEPSREFITSDLSWKTAHLGSRPRPSPTTVPEGLAQPKGAQPPSLAHSSGHLAAQTLPGPHPGDAVTTDNPTLYLGEAGVTSEAPQTPCGGGGAASPNLTAYLARTLPGRDTKAPNSFLGSRDAEKLPERRANAAPVPPPWD